MAESQQEYDFIICGAGTAGLVLASRLTENANVSVLAIEAGKDKRDDFRVNTPGLVLSLWGDEEYDWSFKTVPQKHLNNGILDINRGKGLGGSSMINFMQWANGSLQDLDNWAALGNPGWDAKGLQEYMTNAETVDRPEKDHTFGFGASYYAPELRGTSGPIQVNHITQEWDWVRPVWKEAGKNLGYPDQVFPDKGNRLGTFGQPITVDLKTKTRSYSANTYLEQARNRPNLTVVTETLVRKVIFDQSTNVPRATGVEIVQNGHVSTVRCKREVLVCSGTFQSPQLLELSGVGDSSILSKHNIPTVVHNPNVGANLQDHTIVGTAFAVQDGNFTFEMLRDHPEIAQHSMAQYQESRSGPLTDVGCSTGYLSLSQFLPSSIALPRTSNSNTVQHDQLHDPYQGVLQLFAIPAGWNFDGRQNIKEFNSHTYPGGYLTISALLSHPFSRGTVHITSGSVEDAPAIDPNIFSEEIDLEILAYALLHIETQIAQARPLTEHLKRDENNSLVLMGDRRLAKDLEEAKKMARAHASTFWHPIGTCSMLPQADGGVVDTDLKVYGTIGLRVVDASIMPLHVQGNIQSLVYGIAEKAASMIKKEYGL